MKFLNIIDDFDKLAILKSDKIQNTFIKNFLALITYTGTGPAWLCVLLVLWGANYLNINLISEQSIFLNSMIPALIAWCFGHLVKRIFKRKRPEQALTGFKSKVKYLGKNDSFPSNHSGAASALAISLIINSHPFLISVVIWATCISFSRYYLGVHYPSDIFVGIFIGIISSLGFFLL